MKKCRTFVKQAVKANLVSLDDLVTLFYDHVPLQRETGLSSQAFVPHWTALISPNSSEAYIQTPASIKHLTKESLTGLLDICEEVGCNTVYVAIKKGSEESMDFVRSFMSIGFQLVPPTVKHMDGYMFLGYEL
jgi:hypothetical protein